MRLLRLKVQMTSGTFKTALRAAGFRVESGRLVDVSETCPGFVTMPVFRGDGSVDRNGILSKITSDRDAEIARRAGESYGRDRPWRFGRSDVDSDRSSIGRSHVQAYARR
jgi:hypothetical protein